MTWVYEQTITNVELGVPYSMCQWGQIHHEFLVDFPQRLEICAIAPDAKILPIASPVSAVYPSGLRKAHKQQVSG